VVVHSQTARCSRCRAQGGRCAARSRPALSSSLHDRRRFDARGRLDQPLGYTARTFRDFGAAVASAKSAERRLAQEDGEADRALGARDSLRLEGAFRPLRPRPRRPTTTPDRGRPLASQFSKRSPRRRRLPAGWPATSPASCRAGADCASRSGLSRRGPASRCAKARR
jgi:hypothetical protein